jgi:hypothetical protein
MLAQITGDKVIFCEETYQTFVPACPFNKTKLFLNSKLSPEK